MLSTAAKETSRASRESEISKENDIKEIYSYHPGLKTSFQKILVSTEIGLKTKYVTVPTVTGKPPWTNVRYCYEPPSAQVDSRH